MTRTGTIELNAWANSTGSANDSWRTEGKSLDRIFTVDYYEQVARIARDGLFSYIFLSDRPQLVVGETTRPEHTIDPVALLSAVLSRVPDIGGVITATTTYSEPYVLARQIQSANLLTGGRIAWNIVTSWHPAIAKNFSDADLPDRVDRYDKALEFVELVDQLWRSWSFPWAPEDVGKHDAYYGTVKPVDFSGKYYQVAGPLNVPLGPTGRPKRIQAGGSSGGIQLAAKYADYVYAEAGSKTSTRAFREELRQAGLAVGRAPDDLPRLFPAISPLILSSDAEVVRLKAELAEKNRPSDADVDRLAEQLGVDVGLVGRETALLQEHFKPDPNGVIPRGVVNARIGIALENSLSLRGLAEHLATPRLVGTPRNIADFIVEWWLGEVVDGFTISPRYLPDDLSVFVNEVVPLLQQTPYYSKSYAERLQAGSVR